jgi:hypothetical protein
MQKDTILQLTDELDRLGYLDLSDDIMDLYTQSYNETEGLQKFASVNDRLTSVDLGDKQVLAIDFLNKMRETVDRAVAPYRDPAKKVVEKGKQRGKQYVVDKAQQGRELVEKGRDYVQDKAQQGINKMVERGKGAWDQFKNIGTEYENQIAQNKNLINKELGILNEDLSGLRSRGQSIVSQYGQFVQSASQVWDKYYAVKNVVFSRLKDPKMQSFIESDIAELEAGMQYFKSIAGGNVEIDVNEVVQNADNVARLINIELQEALPAEQSQQPQQAEPRPQLVQPQQPAQPQKQMEQWTDSPEMTKVLQDFAQEKGLHEEALYDGISPYISRGQKLEDSLSPQQLSQVLNSFYASSSNNRLLKMASFDPLTATYDELWEWCKSTPQAIGYEDHMLTEEKLRKYVTQLWSYLEGSKELENILGSKSVSKLLKMADYLDIDQKYEQADAVAELIVSEKEDALQKFASINSALKEHDPKLAARFRKEARGWWSQKMQEWMGNKPKPSMDQWVDQRNIQESVQQGLQAPEPQPSYSDVLQETMPQEQNFDMVTDDVRDRAIATGISDAFSTIYQEFQKPVSQIVDLTNTLEESARKYAEYIEDLKDKFGNYKNQTMEHYKNNPNARVVDSIWDTISDEIDNLATVLTSPEIDTALVREHASRVLDNLHTMTYADQLYNKKLNRDKEISRMKRQRNRINPVKQKATPAPAATPAVASSWKVIKEG